jgi:hypothetical protein
MLAGYKSSSTPRRVTDAGNINTAVVDSIRDKAQVDMLMAAGRVARMAVAGRVARTAVVEVAHTAVEDMRGAGTVVGEAALSMQKERDMVHDRELDKLGTGLLHTAC